MRRLKSSSFDFTRWNDRGGLRLSPLFVLGCLRLHSAQFSGNMLAMTRTLSLSVSPDQCAAVASVAAGLGCAEQDVLASALNAYLDLYHWQVAQITEGLREAEAGVFAPEADVDAFFERVISAS